MFFARSFLIVSAVGGAIAQLSNVSSGCKSAVLAVAASPEASCLNPSGLVQVFLQGTSSSIINPVDSWLKGLCALGPCSNDNLSLVVTNVTTGCATELESVLGNTQPAAITAIVQQAYPTVRKGVCLADVSKNNQLCVTQTLSSIETVTGPLTIDKVQQILSNGTSSLSGVNLCTPCVKQIYNIAKTDFPTIFGQGDIATSLQADCGASFVDGASDPNIVQTASNGTASGSSGNTASNTDSSAQISGQQALLSTFLLGLLAMAA